MVPVWKREDWPHVWNIPRIVGSFLLIALYIWAATQLRRPEWWISMFMLGMVGWILYGIYSRATKIHLRKRGQAPHRLVMYPTALILGRGKSRAQYDFRDLQKIRMTRKGRAAWRLRAYYRLNVPVRAMDVVIPGDRRAAATLAGLIRRRIRAAAMVAEKPR